MSNTMISLLIHNLRHDLHSPCKPCLMHINHRVKELTVNKERITFLLPAFPAKSVNTDKTLGALPDLGEALALEKLNTLCTEINRLYSPGANVLICSDGRVFNDLVFVPETNVDNYNNAIKSYVDQKQLNNLRFYDLNDAYPNLTTEEARIKLLSNEATSIEDIKTLVKKDIDMKTLYNGLHRFMQEDYQYIHKEKSKNQIRKDTKILTYMMMQRSQAWSHLLSKKFPQTFRLSIHDYQCGSEKFGIKFLSNQETCATPWHNVVIKEGENYRFVKNREAKSLRASLIMLNGRASHYEL